MKLLQETRGINCVLRATCLTSVFHCRVPMCELQPDLCGGLVVQALVISSGSKKSFEWQTSYGRVTVTYIMSLKQHTWRQHMSFESFCPCHWNHHCKTPKWSKMEVDKADGGSWLPLLPQSFWPLGQSVCCQIQPQALVQEWDGALEDFVKLGLSPASQSESSFGRADGSHAGRRNFEKAAGHPHQKPKVSWRSNGIHMLPLLRQSCKHSELWTQELLRRLRTAALQPQDIPLFSVTSSWCERS